MSYDYSVLYNVQSITFALLLLCTISIWIKKHHYLWLILLVATVFSGLLTLNINFSGIVVIATTGFLYYLYYKKINNRIFKFVIGILVTALTTFLLVHKAPGFNNWRVINATILKENSIPFTMYFNFDKQLVGILIIALGSLATSSFKKVQQFYFRILPMVILGLASIIFLGFILNYIKFDLRTGPILIIWSIANLFFVCVSEEAVFRGFILKELNNIFYKIRFGEYIALIISSTLFGLLHFQGGIKYILLAGFAGIVYGLVYIKTKQIEASIVTHFLLNLVHIIFLTYPALMPPI